MSTKYRQQGGELAEPLTSPDDEKPKEEEMPSPLKPKAFLAWIWQNPRDRAGVLLYWVASVFALIMMIILSIAFSSGSDPTSSWVILCLVELLVFGFAAQGFRNLIALREEVNRLAKNNKELKETNVAIRANVDALSKHNEELSKTSTRLKTLNRRHKQNIKMMSQLQSNLANFAGGNLDGMRALGAKAQAMGERMKDSLIKNEKSLILRCFEEVQDRADATDLTEEQFKRTLHMLPPQYMKFFTDLNKPWLELSGDDGMMSYDEFMRVCDEVVESRVNSNWYQDSRRASSLLLGANGDGTLPLREDVVGNM